MDIQKEIRLILARLKPDVDFEGAQDFIEDGVLDSFDIVLLTNELEQEFGVSIDGELIVPENYNSLSALARLVELAKEQDDARTI